MMSCGYNEKIFFNAYFCYVPQTYLCLPLVFRLSLISVVQESQFLSENAKIIKT